MWAGSSVYQKLTIEYLEGICKQGFFRDSFETPCH